MLSGIPRALASSGVSVFPYGIFKLLNNLVVLARVDVVAVVRARHHVVMDVRENGVHRFDYLLLCGLGVEPADVDIDDPAVRHLLVV